MADKETFLEKVNGLPGVSAKKMFGGHGVFHDGKTFALLTANGEAFLKTDEESKAELEKRGRHKHARMPYYSIPNEIMNEDKLFYDWIKKTISLSKK